MRGSRCEVHPTVPTVSRIGDGMVAPQTPPQASPNGVVIQKLTAHVQPPRRISGRYPIVSAVGNARLDAKNRGGSIIWTIWVVSIVRRDDDPKPPKNDPGDSRTPGIIHLKLCCQVSSVSSPLKNCFVGESAAKSVRSRSQIAGISEDTPRFGDAELADFDRSQPE